MKTGSDGNTSGNYKVNSIQNRLTVFYCITKNKYKSMRLFTCRQLKQLVQKGLFKTLLIMNLTTILLFVVCTSATAKVFSQKVSLSEKNAPLEKIFKEINLQTGYTFVYTRSLLKKSTSISINVHNLPIHESLELCLKDQPLSFNILNTMVILKEKEFNIPKKITYFPTPPIVVQVITGKITDDHGNPLEGATILVKGTGIGTKSDVNGNFSINAEPNSILEISYVGFESKEIAMGNKLDFTIQLIPSVSVGDQIVVVAYGTQKKVSVTGAIASIQTKEIKQSPAANLAVSLAGRLPGLTAIQRSGEPGRDITNLFIRGQGTVNAQSPIVLVDGIERDLTYIDPNEVASVTILKDASSTALFGVRGANGVILVTTRRGTSEQPEINFTTEAGAQDFTRRIKPVNSFDYASLQNLAQENDGLQKQYSNETLEKYRSGSDPLRYPNTNWYNILIKPYSYQQRYNLNISGAAKKVKYFVNTGYLNQGGQFNVEKNLPYDPAFYMKRYNFRSNIDIQLNNSLKAFLNIAGYLEKQNSPLGALNRIGELNSTLENVSPVQYIIGFATALNATVPGPLTPDGQVITFGNVDNPPYGLINRTGYIQQTRSNVTATYGMEQDLAFITKGLSAKVMISFDSRTTNNLFAVRNYKKYIQIIDPNLNGVDGQDSVYFKAFNNDKNTPLSILGARYFATLSNFQGYLNYNRKFNKHSVSALVLYQRQQQIFDNQLPYNLIGLATRLTYDYDNRYLLEFDAGYNGSEQFAPGRRFGFFPAFSGGWVISNEKFLKNNKAITFFKLRGSYGKVGNDRIGNSRFLYLDDVQIGGGGYSSSLNNGQRINTNLLKNEKLQWEVSEKSNIGLEIGLFKDFNLVLDVFKEKRDNVLRFRGTIPVLNGYPITALSPVNIGIIENKGYEVELNYRKHFRNDLSVFAKMNLNYARNKQLFADEPLLSEDYAYRYRQTGYRIDQPFGYIVEGYFKDAEDVANSPVQSVGGHASLPGDFKYKDLNGDGVVNSRDKAPIGYSNIPEYTFGASFGINYKRFDLSVLFQGVTHVYNYYSGTGTFTTSFGVPNYVSRHLESWTAERAASGAPINYPRLTTFQSPNEKANSFFVIDASYLRLKNAEIGYSLPASWAKKIGAKGVRVYANGLNLITWDRLPTRNFDPELVDGLSYPITRLYNLGANVTF